MDVSAEEQGIPGPDEVAATGGGEHRFQKAISAWRNIDLGGLAPQLDKTASEIVENQKEAVLQRKELAQKTKDFRKLDDAAKLGEFKALLKSYQTFVDLLTNHGKTTSSAFLQLYSSLSEAPDPYPLLEASVESLLVSEDTVPKITAENEKLQTSVRSLTKSLEDSEKKVQEEQNLRKKLASEGDSKAKEIEATWQAVIDEKHDNWQAKEKALEEKVENQEKLLAELKASYEVAQRLDQGGQAASSLTASAAELELVSSDLERANQRLAEVESRNEQLRVELAQASTGTKKGVEEDPEFARLQSENTSLQRKLETTKLERETEDRKVQTRLRTLERESGALKEERTELREKLSKQKDYAELKRELEVFKAIEFNDEDAKPNGSADSLEQMLLARNKKLSNEMAVLRVAHQDLQKELEDLRESTSETNAELERAQNLNQTLENDLLSLQQEAQNQFPSGKSVVSRYPGSIRGKKSSPTSSIISGFDNWQRTDDGGSPSILPMVQAQRDRFKKKVSQLEEELSKQYAAVSSLRQEVQSLQKDNLNLYEKTRYVSTYQRHPQASSASAYSASPSNIIQVSDDSSGDTMGRYRSAYESNISPFAAFRGREATRAYRRMSIPERMVYSVTRLVLANRMSRNLFAAYCVALHLLVFVMLYWMSSTDVEKHASNLGEAAVAAGAAVAAAAEPHHGEWHQEVDGVGGP